MGSDKTKRPGQAKAGKNSMAEYALFSLVLAVMGIGILVLAHLISTYVDGFRSIAQTTEGTFVRLSDTRGKYRGVVEFITTNNLKKTLVVAPYRHDYKIGDTIQVFYDPNNHDKAFINDDLEKQTSGLPGLRAFGIGFISLSLLCGAAALFKVLNPNPEKRLAGP